MRDGNCPNGVWTTRGYRNIKDKNFVRAFKRHSTKQIKNRFDTLKKWYCAWVWLGFQTGYGRGPNDEIVATAGWWSKRIKVCSHDVSMSIFNCLMRVLVFNCPFTMQDNKHAKKFQFGNPEYLDLLIEMYQGVAVDGSIAYFPDDEGEEGIQQAAGDEDAAPEGFVQAPEGF